MEEKLPSRHRQGPLAEGGRIGVDMTAELVDKEVLDYGSVMSPLFVLVSM
jgi:hypothetical protein